MAALRGRGCVLHVVVNVHHPAPPTVTKPALDLVALCGSWLCGAALLFHVIMVVTAHQLVLSAMSSGRFGGCEKSGICLPRSGFNSKC